MMRLLGLLGVLILAVSCAKTEDYYDGVSYYDSYDYKNLKQELKKSDFYCEDPFECPSNVGLMYSNKDGYEYNPTIARCTGFLIDDDIVATNSHCVPEYLKNPYEDCKNRIAIAFLKNGKKKIYGCKKVLDFSDHNNTQFDYAFIKIEKTKKLNPVKIRQTGLVDQESLHVMRVTPLSFSLGGVLKKTECRMVMNSLLNIGGTNPFSVTGLARDCEGVPGNSGSPVFSNETQNVVGILQMKWTEKYLEKLEEDFKVLNLDLPSSLPDHFVFTNLSCVGSSGVIQARAECAQGANVSMASQTNMTIDKEKVIEILGEWKKDFLNDQIAYELKFKSSDMIATANPKCIIDTGEQALFYGEFVKELKIGLKAEVDEDLRIRPEIKTSVESKKVYKTEVSNQFNRMSIRSWTNESSSPYSSYRPRRDIDARQIFDCDQNDMSEPVITFLDSENQEVSQDEFLGVSELVEGEEEEVVGQDTEEDSSDEDHGYSYDFDNV